MEIDLSGFILSIFRLSQESEIYLSAALDVTELSHQNAAS
jgi:hypothetical protein